MRKFIFIPVVNDFALFRRALASVDPLIFDEYIIVNNSGSPLPESYYADSPFRVWGNEDRLSFKDTQNAMRNYAISNDFDFYAFMHSDGEVFDGTDRRLVQAIEQLQNSNWGVVFTHYDVLCAFNTRSVSKIGQWADDQWPKDQQSGYFLDFDYYRRISIGGFGLFQLMKHNISHQVSSTLLDRNELLDWQRISAAVRNHYIDKWGGEPRSETVGPSDAFPNGIVTLLE